MTPRLLNLWLARFSLAAVVLAALAVASAARPPRGLKADAAADIPRVSEERTGMLATRLGLRLRLVSDLGNVRILTGDSSSSRNTASAQVSYKVRLEADARDPGARGLLKEFVLTARNTPAGVQLTGTVPWHGFRGRLWVSYEVRVPRAYNLDVMTQAGNIETGDVDGRVSLVTAGGNITAGSVGGPEAAGAYLDTRGGHISVQNVRGELRATTAGGHITAANVDGNALLRTAGGHIRAGTIRGSAQLDTGGGNISVQRVGAGVIASTGGGQLDFGEASSSIRARTAGGGIRIQRVAGPTELETNGGNILLTQVPGGVRASTTAGSITAWFASEGPAASAVAPKLPRVFLASQLESGQGDIIVYLPRELAVTIDATIDRAAEHSIEADPNLPLKLSYVGSGAGARAVRGQCALNGGGQVLRLRTGAGNIKLKLSDTESLIRLNQEMMEQIQRRMELHQRQLEQQLNQAQEQFSGQLEQQAHVAAREAQRAAEAVERQSWRLETLGRRLEQLWLGGIRVDPDTQQRKLVSSVAPVYPDVARQAGLEGTVRLRAFITGDGSVREVKLLEGDPVLAEAAMRAVRQWRYRPTVLDGQPVNVITAVVVEFRLR